MNEDDDLYAGRTLGRYELLVPLATGATAQVWAARMTGSRGFEKIVAVKAMLTEFSDVLDADAMFLDEARLVSRIRHPNVAEVLDLGEENGALYIVMEWVDGEPLQVLAREAHGKGGIPVPVAVRIAKQAAGGLQAAHELADESGRPVGLVHRDVSPQNILVSYDGIVKVIDFGVAKAASNQQRTNVGQIKGKVAYMAPEQMMGEAVDRRTDVFALGVVLYQLLTGKHPFRADNEFATMARIRDKTPAEPPRALNPAIPVALEAILLKALSKPRDDRYASMADLQRALEDVLPASPDENAEVTAWVTKMLAGRAGKKSQAIKEAVKASNERSRNSLAGTSRPSIAPPSSKALSSTGPVSARAGRDGAGPTSSGPASTGRIHAPPQGPITGPPPSAPTTVIARPSSATPSPYGQRKKSPVGLIVVGLALVVAVGLAVWSYTSIPATGPAPGPSAKSTP